MTVGHAARSERFLQRRRGRPVGRESEGHADVGDGAGDGFVDARLRPFLVPLRAPGGLACLARGLFRGVQARQLVAVDSGKPFLDHIARLAGDPLIEPPGIAAPVHGDDFTFAEGAGMVADRAGEGGGTLAGISFLGRDGGEADAAFLERRLQLFGRKHRIGIPGFCKCGANIASGLAGGRFVTGFGGRRFNLQRGRGAARGPVRPFRRRWHSQRRHPGSLSRSPKRRSAPGSALHRHGD